MKTLFIALFSVVTLYFNQETETVIATFTGYSEGTYYFEDDDELMHSFEALSTDAAAKFDLTSTTYIGKKFNITFTVTSAVNEEDEDYDILEITSLDLLQ